MSVLIKGMDEMPEDGAVLVVRHDDNGKAYIKFACTYGYSMELVKLPEKHGRLVEFVDVATEIDDDTGLEEINVGEMLSAYLRMRGAKPIIDAEGNE